MGEAAKAPESGFFGKYIRPAIDWGIELFDDYVTPYIPAAVVTTVGAGLLSVLPAKAFGDEPDASKPRGRAAYSIGIEHEDLGQREEHERDFDVTLWKPRLWKTAATMYREDIKVIAIEHEETENNETTLFGGRLPLHDIIPMGGSEIDISLYGSMMRQRDPSWGLEWEPWSAGGEAKGRIAIPGIKEWMESFTFHVGGDTFRYKIEVPMFSTWSGYRAEHMKLLSGASFPTGTELTVGAHYWGEENSNPTTTTRTDITTFHGLLSQDIRLDIPLIGDVFLALGGSIDNRKKEDQVMTANWCVGTYNGNGMVPISFQHTGSTDFRDRKRFGFMLALDDKFTREMHSRQMGVTEGGMNDFGGALENPLDFYRTTHRPGAEKVRFSPTLRLPDYTRTFGLDLDIDRLKPVGKRVSTFFTAEGVVYPVGVVSMVGGIEDSPVPNWAWFGVKYDSGTRRYIWEGGVSTGRLWIFRNIRAEIEKAEGDSHPSVIVSAHAQF